MAKSVKHLAAGGSENEAVFWAGLAVMIGAAGVVATSAFYALAPVPAALPIPHPALAEALRGTLAGQGLLTAAGITGVIADVIFAAGAFVLMAVRRPAGRQVERLGWAWAAISNLIFVAVDALSAAVLVPLASLEGGAAAYAGFKLLFDVLFVVGTVAFGLGGLAILLSELKAERSVLARPLAWIGLAFSVLGLGASLLYFANVNLAQAIGISIAGGAIIFTVYGFHIARSARRQTQ